jgi:O-antigen/teichoic acid export membrane protein
MRQSTLVRQNLVLFLGGFTAGVGGFVYHSIAGRTLGPRQYGEVAALVGLYTVGSVANLTLVLILARYAADLDAAGRLGAIRHIVRRTSLLLVLPTVAFVLVTTALAVPIARFENFDSPIPVIWLGVAIAAYCYTAVPRGVLQGTQRFTALSANLGLELVVRLATLALLLGVGLAVTGSMIAIAAGVTVAYLIGSFTLRDLSTAEREPVQMRTMVSFGVTAAAGTLGIMLLYNLDVVLAEHYLNKFDGGIYGSLNKIEVIVYYGTLSVSQVLFPRVVEAISTRRHPARLLLLSAGLMTVLGLGAVVVFGLGLSLDNLLVQFLMAVQDRVFIPILGAACVLLVALIALFHQGLEQIVVDVLVTIFALLPVLAIRCALLFPRLQPEQEQAPAA